MPSETRMQTASCVSDGIARYGRYSGLTKTSTALPRLAVLFVLSAASSPCPDLNLIHYIAGMAASVFIGTCPILCPIRRLQTRLSAPTVRTALFESSTP
ncbi:TPA: hypothetical protein ACJ3EQ_000816 [Neisseria meningitidis]|uniref:hypothetical protein n=1 Tax=Neisseria meningitidis TaxID=487 RepID=UPI00139652CF|nr:hypothetical protein [Neisseria meningitidis]MBW3904294.1 hypothetical protein [Neisseria meningitidis]MBW3910683.1 hypothetical protein [Neisseria meningitidis]MBW3920718.1 hypothetical protein [Neisseria meningitidis]MBW3922537.1 hypothetical protein [Neisseria meningitidis]MBW3989784.1 hypothetical protein [Neisseria meningitidis]